MGFEKTPANWIILRRSCGVGFPPALERFFRRYQELDAAVHSRDYVPEMFISVICAFGFLALGTLSIGLPVALKPSISYSLLSACALLIVGTLFYTPVRQRPGLAAIMLVTGTSLAAQPIGLLLGYEVQYRSRHALLIDPILAACDRSIGFDWLSLLRWANEHPVASSLLHLCYDMCGEQFLLCVVLFTLTHRSQRLLVLLSSSLVSLIIVHLVPLFYPCLGPYSYFGAEFLNLSQINLSGAANSVAGVLAMRRGDTSIVTLGNLVGTVTFPSFHAVMALQFAWALSCFKGLRFPAMIFNGAVLVSSMIYGSHYLIDLIAGSLLGIVSIVLIYCLCEACRRQWPTGSLRTTACEM